MMSRKRSLFLFLAAFALPASVKAEAGLDFLGIKIESGWDCDGMLAPLGRLAAPVPVGWLDDTTFGKSTVCLERLLASGKVSKARAHLLNNTCVRNRVCWAGDRLNGYTLSRLEQEALTPGSPLLELVCTGAKTIEGYAKRFPSVRFRVSGLLEHNLTRDAAIAVAARVRTCAPGTDVVDNPVMDPRSLYPPIPEAIRESHGPSVNPITSLDGISVEDVNVEEWKKANARNDMTLIWAVSYNCRVPGKWVQPNLRKNCPTADQFALYTQLIRAETPVPKKAPPQCKTIQQLSPPWFYKSAAADDGTGKPQADKPLVTSPIQGERLEVLDSNGGAIAWMKHSGSAPGGYARYFLGLGSGQTAFQLGQEAEKRTLSEWVILSAGAESSSCVWANAYRSAPIGR